MIALLSCLTYLALDFFGAKRPAILGRFKVPLTQVAGLMAFWVSDEAWARDFRWPSYRPSARPWGLSGAAVRGCRPKRHVRLRSTTELPILACARHGRRLASNPGFRMALFSVLACAGVRLAGTCGAVGASASSAAPQNRARQRNGSLIGCLSCRAPTSLLDRYALRTPCACPEFAYRDKYHRPLAGSSATRTGQMRRSLFREDRRRQRGLPNRATTLPCGAGGALAGSLTVRLGDRS
jgi:hypothetical protein